MLTCDLGHSPKKRHTEGSSFFGFEGNFALPCLGDQSFSLNIFFFFFSSVALGLTFWLILVGLTSITGPLLSDTVLGVRNSKIKTTVFGVKKPNLEDSDNGNTV